MMKNLRDHPRHKGRSWGALVAGLIGLLSPPPLWAKGSKGVSSGGYYPKWRLEGGSGVGTYSERAEDDPIGRRAQVDGQPFRSSHYLGAVAFDGYETEWTTSLVHSDSLAPWSKRMDLSLRESYYWKPFPWILPSVGYWEMRQEKKAQGEGESDIESGTGSESIIEPIALISRNTGLSFGLTTRFAPSPWTGHGPSFMGRLDYRSSLEAKRNFGTLATMGAGYYVATGRLRWTLEWRLARDFFNATRVFPEEDGRQLSVRSVSTMRQIWLSLSFGQRN